MCMAPHGMRLHTAAEGAAAASVTKDGWGGVAAAKDGSEGDNRTVAVRAQNAGARRGKDGTACGAGGSVSSLRHAQVAITGCGVEKHRGEHRGNGRVRQQRQGRGEGGTLPPPQPLAKTT